MKDGPTRIALLALVTAAAAACVTSGTKAGSRRENAPPLAQEVVVRTKIDARGAVAITPDPAIVRAGQKLVFDSCCETLRITWKRPVPRIPEPRCEGGECILVAPDVREPIEVAYAVSGTCSGRRFEVDPRLVFVPVNP